MLPDLQQHEHDYMCKHQKIQLPSKDVLTSRDRLRLSNLSEFFKHSLVYFLKFSILFLRLILFSLKFFLFKNVFIDLNPNPKLSIYDMLSVLDRMLDLKMEIVFIHHLSLLYHCKMSHKLKVPKFTSKVESNQLEIQRCTSNGS